MNPFKPLALAVAAALCAPAALAQTPPAAEDAAETAQRLDRVTVTGSNIRGIDLEDSQPVRVIDAEEIRSYGAVNVAELLREISQTAGGTGNFNTTSSGALQADSPAGSAAASLRGLGSSATLTLVNGRRIAVSSFANGSESFIDINAIPVAAVERVEILSTGASAVYGADAVAGVVNFVLREDFEGLRISASYGDSFRGTDEARMYTNLVTGFRGESTRGMLVVDAFQRNALYDRDRAISAVEPRPSQQGVFPSFIDFFGMDDELVEAACPDEQRFDGRPGFPRGGFGEYCALNRNQFTATDPWQRRIGAYGTFGAFFGNGLEYFAELALQRNQAEADSAPAPWSVIEGVPFSHPDFPEELRERLIDAGADDRFPIDAFGRFPDARTLEVTTTNWRLLNGLRGSLGTGWDWETTLTASRSRAEQEAVAGIYNRERVLAGLRGTLCADGSTGCTPGGDGLWYNPFGGQAVQDPAVLALVREQVPRSGSSTLYAWDGRLNGFAGALGGGDIGWALGAEARREKVADRPSPLATAGPENDFVVPVFGFGSTAVDASRTQWAVFAESFLPVTERFDIRVAGRYDHYDDFGGDFNPALSFRWRPSDFVLLRGGWNTSFRAPSLAQVGAGVTLSSGALPCSPGSEFFDSFCGGFSGDDGYLSEIYGNPELKAETAEAWYLGTVFNLGDNTTLKIDYWRFDQRDLVDIDDLELFRRALADPSLVFDSRGARPPFGQVGIGTRGGAIGDPVDDVFLSLINVGRQRTDGVDIGFDHRFPETGLGRLSFYTDATWVRSFQRSQSCSATDPSTRRGAGPCVDGQQLIERVGEFRFPEWTVNAGLRLTRGDVTARLWANHVDGYYDDDERADVPAERRIGSWTTANLNLDWDFSERQTLGLTIRNLADRDPPVALGSAANVDLFNHNTLGRTWTLTWIYRH